MVPNEYVITDARERQSGVLHLQSPAVGTRDVRGVCGAATNASPIEEAHSHRSSGSVELDEL